MQFRAPQGGLLVVTARVSRKLIARVIPRLTAAVTAETLTAMLGALPPTARHALTCDNGPEFADHQTLAKTRGTDIWFCPPHAPWTKSRLENTIGRLRRALPRKTPNEVLDETVTHQM